MNVVCTLDDNLDTWNGKRSYINPQRDYPRPRLQKLYDERQLHMSDNNIIIHNNVPTYFDYVIIRGGGGK